MVSNKLLDVWSEAQARRDMRSIACEIIGHFATLASTAEPQSSQSFDFIVWMKVIYDLQRTYLQAADPSTESRLYLISSRIILTTLNQILERIPHSRQRQSPDHNLQPDFAARALSSGIRALQLQMRFGEDSIRQNIKLMRISIQDLLIDVEEERPEKFILERCIHALLKMESSTADSSWSRPAGGKTVLRDNQTVLYPALEPNALGVFEDTLKLLSGNDQNSFWVLFDILWAAEVGWIQWHVDKRSAKDFIEYENETTALMSHIKARRQPSHLEMHWTSQYNENDCKQDSLQSQIDTSLRDFYIFLHTRRMKILDQNMEFTTLSTELHQSIESWIRHESRYRDGDDIRGDQQALNTAYVLSCPQLHVVSKYELTSHIKNDSHHIFQNKSLIDIRKYEIYCPRCQKRSIATLSTHARAIEPLQYLSERLAQLIARSDQVETGGNSTASQTFNHEESASIRTRTLSNAQHHPISEQLSRPETLAPGPNAQMSLYTTGSSDTVRSSSPRRISTESRDAKSANSSFKGKNGLFGSKFSFKKSLSEDSRVSNESGSSRKQQVFDSYRFSDDGRKLMLWNKGKPNLYSAMIPKDDGSESASAWEWTKFNIPGPLLVVGTEDRVAVVSKVDKLYKLSLYEPANNLEGEPDFIRTMQQVHHIYSVAISKTGRFIAVGSDRKVLIYDTHNNSTDPNQILLGSLKINETVNSQQISFTGDSKLAIATRVSNGLYAHTEIILFEIATSKELWNRIHTNDEQKTDQDHGLTAIYYDDQMARIVITGYTNKPYWIVYSKSGSSGEIRWNTQNGKIQAVAKCPAGSRYILLTGNGSFFKLDLKQTTPSLLMKPKRKFSPPRDADEFVALAVPEDNCIYTIRVESGQMIFEVARGNLTPTKKGFKGPLSIDS